MQKETQNRGEKRQKKRGAGMKKYKRIFTIVIDSLGAGEKQKR